MSVRNAKASNWVAERAEATDSVFDLKGSSKSYTSFSRAFSAGDTVFYSAHDEKGNREAGYGVFNGSTEITRNPTATLVNNAYNSNSPSKVSFSGEVTVACTFNASAFNTLWKALDAIDPDGDGGINIPPELIEGLVDTLNSKADQVDLEKEIQDRIDGDQALQDQIDALDPDGDLVIDWSEIEGKPTEFPPEAHNHDGVYAPVGHGHEIDDVNGLQDALDAAGSTPAWDDVTGKPTEFPPAAHTQDWSTITNTPSEYPPEAHDHDGVYAPVVHGHEIDEINGLQDALDSAGGNPAWDDITGKPTEFPPEAHTHEQGDVDGLELRLEAIEDSITSGGGFVDAPNDGRLYGRQSEAWAEVVIPDGGASSWDEIADKPTEFPPAAHNQGWDTITGKPADYPPSAHGHEIAEINGLSDALTDAGAPTAWNDVTGKPAEFPPEDHTHLIADITDFDPADYQPAGEYVGEAPNDGKPYVRKSEAWEEMPTTGGGSSLWEQNLNDIYYDAGNVGIGTDKPSVKLTIEDDTNAILIRGKNHGNTTFLGYDTNQDFAINTQAGGIDLFTAYTIGGDITFSPNASEAMRISAANGNVGIGTDNPTLGKLVVTDTASFVAANSTSLAGAGYAMFVNGGNNGVGVISTDEGGHMTFDTGATGSVQAEAMRIDANGNVGIGTNNNPTAMLQVGNDGVTSYATPALSLLRNHGGQPYENRQGTQFYWNTSNGAGESEIVYGNNSTAFFRLIHNDNGTFTERMRIDANGNVGIGTDNPTGDGVSIHVDSTTSNSTLHLTNSTTGGTVTDGTYITTTGNDFLIRNREAGYVATYTSNTERMRIDADGHVCIGQDAPSITTTGLYLRKGIESGIITDNSPALVLNRLNSDGILLKIAKDGVVKGSIGGFGDSMTFHTGGADTERVRIDANGNVGIGSPPNNVVPLSIGDGPPSYGANTFAITIGGMANSRDGVLRFEREGQEKASIRTVGDGGYARKGLGFFVNGAGDYTTGSVEAMRIDSSGRVGIGGQASRSAKEIAKEAKDTLARWKSNFDERLKAEPKADKKAVTLEITNDEFDTFPTEETLVERLQERNIGGGTAKLQVAGDGHFNGDLRADGVFGRFSSAHGLSFAFNTYPSVNPIRGAAPADGQVDLGESGVRWKDGHFSGTIYGTVADVPAHVKAITPTQIANWDAGTGGGGGATTDGRISDTQITHWDTAYGWGNHATAGYQPAGSYADANHNHSGVYAPASHTHSQYLTSSSLDGYATESWVNSQGFAKGSFVPTSGNTTISGTLTATDFVATSDERMKDEITPMPVGLIDDIKPAQWTWKDSGKKSAGVIAQQLQEIGLDDFVSEGEDGMLGVNYNALTSVLLAEVIALKKQVQELSK